jgi:predicted permease
VTLDDFEAVLGTQSFEAVAAYDGLEMTVDRDDDVASVMRVSSRFFDVMRGRAIEGRLFMPADREANGPRAVVGELTWRRRFAGRRITEATSIRLNGREHAVVGVLPASFSYPILGMTADAWIPLARPLADGDRVVIVARLAPGVSWEAAAGELATLAPPNRPEAGWRWECIPVARDVSARTGGATMWIFLPAAVVLVIGCVNVASMLLARGIRRDTELSVRMALGSGRGAIVKQLLAESALLGLAAGTVGTALAFGALQSIVSIVIDARPEAAAKLSGDLGLLPIALTSSIVACLLFGVVPAVRLSHRDLALSLRGGAPPGRVRIAGYGARDLVVFVELALASVLVVMTAMSFAVFSVIQDIRFGFAVHELIDAGVPARGAAAAADRVRLLDGVTHVALTSGVPGGGTSASASVPGGRTAVVSIVETGDGFFDATGLAIVRGRSFRPDETAGAAVAIVSETTAAALWPGADPLGREVDVNLRGRSTRLQVVGMASDAMRMAVPRARPGQVYRPLDPAAHDRLSLLVRSPNPRAAARRVTDAVRPRDAVGVAPVRILADATRELAGTVRILWLFGGFALIALLLAGSGIFAVVSQSVAQRTTEFGVRLALGATPRRLLRTVLARELKLIAAALAAGTIGTVAMTRSSGFDDAAFIVAVTASNPAWAIGLIGLCGVVAAGACLLATYRIVTLDPSVALRRT